MVGLSLIALSIVLARKPPAPEEPPSVTPEPLTDVDRALFIDQPLQTDMATALGPVATSPGEEESTESVPVETTSSEQADDDPTEETPVVGLQTENDTGGSTRPDKED